MKNLNMKFSTVLMELIFLHALTWTCIKTEEKNADHVCRSDQCKETEVPPRLSSSDFRIVTLIARWEGKWNNSSYTTTTSTLYTTDTQRGRQTPANVLKKIRAALFKKNMNTAVLPCHNFYEFMCGNFKKWNPLFRGMPGTFMITSRQVYINHIISSFLFSERYTNSPASLEKAKTVYHSCVDKETTEKFGDIPIPLELNTIGLPIAPPFNLPLNEPLNFSKLLAKIHRSPFTHFLFDIRVAVDVRDASKTRLAFDYTPSINHLMRTNKSKNPEMLQNRYHLSETELKKKKKWKRTMLIQVMEVAIKYMIDFTNARSSKKTNELIGKRINDVADFLLILEETKELENVEDGDNPDTITYITLDELQEETNKILGNENAQIQINWYAYVEELFADIRDDAYEFFKGGELIFLKDMKQFKAVLRILSKVSQKVVVSAIWWLVVDSVSPFATQYFRELNYSYNNQIGKQQSPPGPWQCFEMVKAQFTNLFAHMLIQTEKNAYEDRKEVNEMVANIREAYQESISQATWLDAATKMAALNKLKNISQKISFSDSIADAEKIDAEYNEVFVNPNLFYLNTRSVRLAARKKELEGLGQDSAISTDTTLLDPLTVNAAHAPFTNSIEAPIGILGPPYYGLGLQALNYGAIGSVLSHEIGHAFDNLGSRFDSEGKIKSWWKKKTIAKYAERNKCFVDFFSDIYFPEVNKKVNGKLTLNENIADFLGVQLAIKAYRKYVAKHGKEKLLPDFEHLSHEKLLTMAFAAINCCEIPPSVLEYTLEKDEHAPNKARVLGVMKNSYEFAEIWKCSSDHEMNPKKKCVVW